MYIWSTRLLCITCVALLIVDANASSAPESIIDSDAIQASQLYADREEWAPYADGAGIDHQNRRFIVTGSADASDLLAEIYRYPVDCEDVVLGTVREAGLTWDQLSTKFDDDVSIKSASIVNTTAIVAFNDATVVTYTLEDDVWTLNGGTELDMNGTDALRLNDAHLLDDDTLIASIVTIAPETNITQAVFDGDEYDSLSGSDAYSSVDSTNSTDSSVTTSALHIFKRSGSVWKLNTRIPYPYSMASRSFASSFSIDRQTGFLAACDLETEFPGGIVYRRNPTSDEWEQVSELNLDREAAQLLETPDCSIVQQGNLTVLSSSQLQFAAIFTNFNLTTTIVGDGDDDNQSTFPSGVAIASDEKLVMADSDLARLHLYEYSADTSQWINTFIVPQQGLEPFVASDTDLPQLTNFGQHLFALPQSDIVIAPTKGNIVDATHGRTLLIHFDPASNYTLAPTTLHTIAPTGSNDYDSTNNTNDDTDYNTIDADYGSDSPDYSTDYSAQDWEHLNSNTSTIATIAAVSIGASACIVIILAVLCMCIH